MQTDELPFFFRFIFSLSFSDCIAIVSSSILAVILFSVVSVAVNFRLIVAAALALVHTLSRLCVRRSSIFCPFSCRVLISLRWLDFDNSSWSFFLHLFCLRCTFCCFHLFNNKYYVRTHDNSDAMRRKSSEDRWNDVKNWWKIKAVVLKHTLTNPKHRHNNLFSAVFVLLVFHIFCLSLLLLSLPGFDSFSFQSSIIVSLFVVVVLTFCHFIISSFFVVVADFVFALLLLLFTSSLRCAARVCHSSFMCFVSVLFFSARISLTSWRVKRRFWIKIICYLFRRILW